MEIKMWQPKLHGKGIEIQVLLLSGMKNEVIARYFDCRVDTVRDFVYRGNFAPPVQKPTITEVVQFFLYDRLQYRQVDLVFKTKRTVWNNKRRMLLNTVFEWENDGAEWYFFRRIFGSCEIAKTKRKQNKQIQNTNI